MSRISPPRDTAPVNLSAADFTSSNGFNAIYVGGTGNLAVIKQNGQTEVYQNIAAGMFHPIQGVGIAKTGTTATGLIVAFS